VKSSIGTPHVDCQSVTVEPGELEYYRLATATDETFDIEVDLVKLKFLYAKALRSKNGKSVLGSGAIVIRHQRLKPTRPTAERLLDSAIRGGNR
jgi:hypothetical protein